MRGLPLAAAAVAAISLVSIGQEIVAFAGGTQVAMGQESPDAVELLDPTSANILLIGEARHFGLPVQRAAPAGFNTHPLADSLGRTGDPVRTSRELRELGLTRVIVDLSWVERSAASYHR